MGNLYSFDYNEVRKYDRAPLTYTKFNELLDKKTENTEKISQEIFKKFNNENSETAVTSEELNERLRVLPPELRLKVLEKTNYEQASIFYKTYPESFLAAHECSNFRDFSWGSSWSYRLHFENDHQYRQCRLPFLISSAESDHYRSLSCIDFIARLQFGLKEDWYDPKIKKEYIKACKIFLSKTEFTSEDEIEKFMENIMNWGEPVGLNIKGSKLLHIEDLK